MKKRLEVITKNSGVIGGKEIEFQSSGIWIRGTDGAIWIPLDQIKLIRETYEE